MLSLRDTQRAFCSAMLSGDAACMKDSVRDAGIPAEQRLQIYGNSSRIGFLAAMQATYPVIKQLAGEQWFEQRARHYQLLFPSRSGDLQYVGSSFAEFLQAELAGTDFEYFADVARLEWAYQEVLIAADSATFDLAELGTVAANDYECLMLTPRSALRLIESAFPILAIWQAHQPGANSIEIRLDAGASRVLLTRHTDHVELRELPPATAALLEQCLRGVVLGAAVDAVTASHHDVDLSACLQQLMTLRCFARFHLQPPGFR
jgi:hypothetical protein